MTRFLGFADRDSMKAHSCDSCGCFLGAIMTPHSRGLRVSSSAGTIHSDPSVAHRALGA